MIPRRYSAHIKELWTFVRPLRWRAATALAGLVFVSGASLVYPWLLRIMVDDATGRRSEGVDLDILCLTLVGVFAASSVIGYFQQKEMRVLGFRFRNTVRRSLFRSLLGRSMTFHRSSRVGELSARSMEDSAKLQHLFSGLISPAVQNALFVTGCLVLMARLNWIATLFVLGFVAIPVPVMLSLRSKLRDLSARTQAEHGRANALLEESLVALREIKAFVREKAEVSRYGRMLNRALATETELAAVQLRIDQSIYLLFSVSLTGIFYAGTRGNLLPAWSIGDVIAFYFYSYTMTMALLSIARTYLSAQEFAGVWARVSELIAFEEESAAVYRDIDPVTGGVEFASVSFAYETGRPVLNGVSLSLNPGEWLLITGTSGSGKSTMASLLMGLLHPDGGRIRVDGMNLAERDTGTLRKYIGYVGQDPMLFHGTVRDNLLLADPTATWEQLERVVKIACLDELVDSLPRGLETRVGERGYTLSNGQKARIAIARALLLDPPILILDEANATIEGELERQFWRNLVEDRGNKTTIIFSHHVEHIPSICSAARLCEGILLPVQKEEKI